MSSEAKRIAADILIAKIQKEINEYPSAEELASQFQTLYNQVKFADQPQSKPASIDDSHPAPAAVISKRRSIKQ